MQLRTEYYEAATVAERNLVAVLMVDRKLLRLDCVRRIRTEFMADSLSAHILAVLQSDPFSTLESLMNCGGYIEVATAVNESFWWLVEWYASEVQRFIDMRMRLLELLDFQHEFCG